MAMKQLLDTNIILYFLGGKLKNPLDDNEYYVSVITQLELLSYYALDYQTESAIDAFLKEVEIINLDPQIIAKTIEIRKKYKFKLPDSIIIATAKVFNLEVLSNDQQFSKVPEIICKNLVLLETKF